MYARDVPPGTIFYHGTKADLKAGDLISPGFGSNFVERGLKRIYFSATLEAAIWGAELARGEGLGRIYIVEPTGEFDDDPNLTDKKFPGNITASYRSAEPLAGHWRGPRLGRASARAAPADARQYRPGEGRGPRGDHRGLNPARQKFTPSVTRLFAHCRDRFLALRHRNCSPVELWSKKATLTFFAAQWSAARALRKNPWRRRT
jgi:rifampin ADP-ribosylating transferase